VVVEHMRPDLRPDLLLLVDGRFPAGGHAYSAGVEAAVGVGDVTDTASLARYLDGRLATTGCVDAAFSAAACASLELPEAFGPLDDEYGARVPSPHLRATSRRLGRQLLRAARPIWPHSTLDLLAAIDDGADHGAHQPIALGAVVAAAGGGPSDAAAISLHHLGAAVTSAAVRLLGLDPIALAGVQAHAARTAAAVLVDADRWAIAAPSELPACGGLLTEILGEEHGRRDARLFVA
jgi:urease accessory protein